MDVRLNQDVLQHICAYLDSRDALSLALTSKAFYDVAIARVPAIITCSTPAQLCRLWNYATGDEDHASRMRSLTITILALDTHSPPPDYGEFIGDLLEAARNLTHLHLRLCSLLLNDARVRSLMTSFVHVTHLELDQVTHRAVGLLRTLEGPVQTLHVRCCAVPEDIPTTGFEDDLLSAALSLKTLRALSVVGTRSRITRSDRRDRVRPLPYCSSLRRLVVLAFPFFPISEDILRFCPQLESLAVAELGATRLTDAPVDSAHELRYLNVLFPDFLRLVETGRIARVRYLHARGGNLTYAGEAERASLMHAVRRVAPLGLHLSFVLYTDAPASFVLLPDVAPQLRCLSLTIAPGSLRPSDETVEAALMSWLTQSCSELPILCLRLFMSTVDVPPYIFGRRGPATEHLTSPAARTTARIELAAELELTSALPAAMAKAVPTARYISISTTLPEAMGRCQDDIYDTNGSQDAECWWRVDSGCGDARVCRLIPRAEGVRVCHAILDAEDDDAVATVLRMSL